MPTKVVQNLSEQVRELSTDDQLWLAEKIISWVRDAEPQDTLDEVEDNEPWDIDELRAF